MKRIGLIIVCFLAASYPATAKVFHHHHHHLHRHVRSSEHHDHAGVTPQKRLHITCDTVRAYVAQVGLESPWHGLAV